MRSDNSIILVLRLHYHVIAKDVRDSIATYIGNQFNGNRLIDNQLSFFLELIIVTVIILIQNSCTHAISRLRDKVDI